ncbi:uncharacterized protein LOC129592411 [Paramacrobiotus metropolitanus]|uniref:uncharacterized protein LOC129592411 n=1 Tax=Paramacrobiotus metropolitanus TaxID=2943436 RepID=UPI002445F331|nr:uncharacterized protein LOC129592411 [Paramacrobiotus metropolitanus]
MLLFVFFVCLILPTVISTENREIYGDDGSPVLRSEELSSWPKGTPSPHDDDEEEGEEASEEVVVENDEDEHNASPPELRGKARGLIVESNKDASYLVWSVWGPWSRCSKSCGYGLRRRVRKCVNGLCKEGYKTDQVERCFTAKCLH